MGQAKCYLWHVLIELIERPHWTRGQGLLVLLWRYYSRAELGCVGWVTRELDGGKLSEEGGTAVVNLTQTFAQITASDNFPPRKSPLASTVLILSLGEV